MLKEVAVNREWKPQEEVGVFSDEEAKSDKHILSLNT